jgi:hypothetical protein
MLAARSAWASTQCLPCASNPSSSPVHAPHRVASGAIVRGRSDD